MLGCGMMEDVRGKGAGYRVKQANNTPYLSEFKLPNGLETFV
jgi:hypothetical protein